MRKLLVLLAVGALAAPALDAAPRADARPSERVEPIVIAIVETGSGLNVLHDEFKSRPGERMRLPADMPRSVAVRLPKTGTFDERIRKVSAGPLGSMKPGTLYRIKGTRVIGVYNPPNASVGDLTYDRWHGTSVSGAAVGTRYGTDPDALLVYVMDSNERAWRWLVEQEWIDVISVSSFNLVNSTEDKAGACQGAAAVREISEQGRLVFTAAGNGDQFEQAVSPAGVAEAYQVGGVDENGRSYSWPGRGPSRPYETGDRWEARVADPDALSGSWLFGGTSGAAPSTAGRAAELWAFGREVLRRGAPDRGPLADGELSGDELTRLMHHVATPAETGPGRYLIEGYGAFTERETALARKVLAGTKPEPVRDQEDVLHTATEAARQAMYGARLC